MQSVKQYRITFYESAKARLDPLEFAWLVSRHNLGIVGKPESRPALIIQCRWPDQIAKFASDVNALYGPLIFESVEVLDVEEGEYDDLDLGDA